MFLHQHTPVPITRSFDQHRSPMIVWPNTCLQDGLGQPKHAPGHQALPEASGLYCHLDLFVFFVLQSVLCSAYGSCRSGKNWKKVIKLIAHLLCENLWIFHPLRFYVKSNLNYESGEEIMLTVLASQIFRENDFFVEIIL